MMNWTSRVVGAGAIVGLLLAAAGCDGMAVGDGATGESESALAYGTWGQLVGYGGRCLDLRGGRLGDAVQLFDCNGGSNQQWTFSNPNGPVFNGVGYAVGLTELGNGIGENVTVRAWGSGPANARWTMPDAQFHTQEYGFCLRVGSYNQLIVDQCFASGTFWTFDESLTPIRWADGRCVTSTGTANGSEVILASCTGGANQNWQLSSGGTIRQAGLCLDVRGGINESAVVQLFRCTGGSNQKWTISGHLADSLDGHCMAPPETRWGPVTATGTAVVMSACNSAMAWYWDPQSWTFRW